MIRTFILLSILIVSAVTASAATEPEIIFTQEVYAFGPDGKRLTQVVIEPDKLTGARTIDLALGRGRTLRIATNIEDPAANGLNELAATVRRCYDYIEQVTGRSLSRGILLYLIEFDQVPTTYSFRAEYDNSNQWSEVRLALLERGAKLSGPEIAPAIADLLYDTLPHELGHDIFGAIPQLAQDTDAESHGTRWFIEGVCEILAKGFSQQEAPAWHRRFVALRDIDKIVAQPELFDVMLAWAQSSRYSPALESDLYGAAFVAMTIWTDSVPLIDILPHLTSSYDLVNGDELIVMMERMTGVEPGQRIPLAPGYRERFADGILVARVD